MLCTARAVSPLPTVSKDSAVSSAAASRESKGSEQVQGDLTDLCFERQRCAKEDDGCADDDHPLHLRRACKHCHIPHSSCWWNKWRLRLFKPPAGLII